MVGAAVVVLPDRQLEAIAATRDRDNESVIARLLSQRLAQMRHRHGQIGIFDQLIRPDTLHQFIFGYLAPATLD